MYFRMLALEEVYDVTMVKDGQEAFDTVKTNMEKGLVFDLIFMDIQVRSADTHQRQPTGLPGTKCFFRCQTSMVFKAPASFVKWAIPLLLLR